MIIPKFKAMRATGKQIQPGPSGFALDQSHRERYGLWMEQFKDGDELEITVKKRRKLRTSGQPGEETNFNGYYFGVVVKIIAEEIGEFDTKLVHYWIQEAVGNVKMMPNGKLMPKGTSHMTGQEFAEYCGKVRMWASKELNCYVPEPHEAEWG